MPETTQTYTWTKHTFKCTDCGQLCYASQEAIDQYRKDAWVEEGTTDKDIGEGFEFCLGCVGALVTGEKVALAVDNERSYSDIVRDGMDE